jgi:hypothetical protein
MIYISVFLIFIVLILTLTWRTKQNQDQQVSTVKRRPQTDNSRSKGIPIGSVPHPTQSKHPNPAHNHIQHDPDDTKGEETHPDHLNHTVNQGQTEPRTSSGPGSIQFGMKYIGEQVRVVNGVAGLGACIDVCQDNTENICTAASINMATGKCRLFKNGKLVKSNGHAAWVSQPVV